MRRQLFGPETSGPGILNYHSSHEERIERSPLLRALECEKKTARPRGFFARLLGGTKAAKITFFNIIFLVFLLIFYSIMVARIPPGTWTQSGFRFSLSAYSRENRVFTSLRVTKEKSGVWAGDAPEITLESSSERESFSPALPAAKGEIAYIRTVFSLPESRQIFCVIRFDGKTHRLTVHVKEE